MRVLAIMCMTLVYAAFGCGPDNSWGGGTPDGDADSDADGDGDGDGDGDSDADPPPDAEPPTGNPDAFWAEDPPPEYCGPDGERGDPPEVPGGTPECPDDKNREGCPCPELGETAPCWPGLRANRNRGICRDGVTECMPFDEFYYAWGPCEGYVLPVEGVELGPEACMCFSRGQWALANMSPCFITYSSGETWAVSTYVTAGGAAACPSDIGTSPPPTAQPGTDWTTNTLLVDCAGRFELCYTLRAGSVDAPSDTDCVVAEVCTEAWYEEADVVQELPPLPSWVGSDPACARAFATSGGYGEMSVLGLSIECDDISDGGARYVFHRVGYCPLDCAERPSDPDCVDCRQGGSGEF